MLPVLSTAIQYQSAPSLYTSNVMRGNSPHPGTHHQSLPSQQHKYHVRYAAVTGECRYRQCRSDGEELWGSTTCARFFGRHVYHVFYSLTCTSYPAILYQRGNIQCLTLQGALRHCYKSVPRLVDRGSKGRYVEVG
jgi:hypothetical protein